MKNKYLYNQKSKEELLRKIKKEPFDRVTCSFYKYVPLENIERLRDQLYVEWNSLQVLGRIYISKEGINAQLSIPEYIFENFQSSLYSFKPFKNIPLKKAIEEGISFLKLTIKIKDEIVAYKISENEYDINKVGNHLNYKKFNKAIDDGANVIDMRNYYEGEIGKFENAIIPDVDTSMELLPEIKKLLEGKENEKVIMYCTGGIRCEKASSYLIHHGFKDVSQLKGGIIQYANDIKKNKVKSKFIGKNFVFDHRLGENITNDIISQCHQCDKLTNEHKNCLNQACHILFIQCKECSDKFNSCCSKQCCEFIKLPKDEQKELFKSGKIKFTAQKSNRVKPKLSEL
ncbi:MAG: hypothetical protein CMG00_05720 [Candidatus Marinimicrobia bacterium]|nr:hypothetical protein [Candidatus Neomarinimicrobiota bacterium]|tara:strand:+ start:127 stop:1158 length:1032 start_codon:yes stop_codon:yes gene_type:complete